MTEEIASIPKLSVIELAVEMVKCMTVARPEWTTDDVCQNLCSIHDMLWRLANDETNPLSELDQLRANPSESITLKNVTCLECGKSYRMLSYRHLKLHNISSSEYKSKWGLRKRQPLIAVRDSQTRSKSAKARGAGQWLQEYRESHVA